MKTYLMSFLLLLVNNHSVLQSGYKYHAHIMAYHATQFPSDGTRIKPACETKRSTAKLHVQVPGTGPESRFLNYV